VPCAPRAVTTFAARSSPVAGLTSVTPPTMSICHNCIGPGRSRRRYESRAAASAAEVPPGPCRIKIRSMVARDRTTQPSGGFFNSSNRIRFDPHRGCLRRNSATCTSTAAGARCGHDAGRCQASPETRQPWCPSDAACLGRCVQTFSTGSRRPAMRGAARTGTAFLSPPHAARPRQPAADSNRTRNMDDHQQPARVQLREPWLRSVPVHPPAVQVWAVIIRVKPCPCSNSTWCEQGRQGLTRPPLGLELGLGAGRCPGMVPASAIPSSFLGTGPARQATA
jgi:hypothetical protein